MNTTDESSQADAVEIIRHQERRFAVVHPHTLPEMDLLEQVDGVIVRPAQQPVVLRFLHHIRSAAKEQVALLPVFLYSQAGEQSGVLDKFIDGRVEELSQLDEAARITAAIADRI